MNWATGLPIPVSRPGFSPARLRERNCPNERNSQCVSRIRFATIGILFRRSTHVSLVFCPLLWNIRSVTGRFRFPCFSAHECRRLVEYVRERDKIRQRVVRHGGRKHLLACLK